MRHLHEEIKQHIHGDLCGEVNEMIINIKLHHIPLNGENAEAIIKAKANHPLPSWEDIITILTKIRDEMNECKIPFKRF